MNSHQPGRAGDGLRFHTTAPGSVPGVAPRVAVELSFETLLVLMAMGWMLWEKAIRPSLQERMASAWAPVEEERRLNTLLAQMAILSGADRAILTAFHNGSMDHDGYHLQRMTTINQFVGEGSQPMPKPIKDLPIGRVMVEVEAMLSSGTWTPIRREKGQPPLCVKHLADSGIHYMANRLVKVGNLPIGIVSMQYTSKRRSYFDCQKNASKMIMLNGLFDQVCITMRRRVIRPPIAARIRMAVQQTLEVRGIFRRR